MLGLFASINAFTQAYTQSDFFGKLIILGLVALSMICWIVLVHKLWIIRQVSRLSKGFESALETQKASLLSLEPAQLPFPQNQGVPHPFGQIFFSLRGKTLE